MSDEAKVVGVSNINNGISNALFFGGMRVSALIFVWYYYVQYNFVEPKIFFISTFIYTCGFIYDYLRTCSNNFNKINFLTQILGLALFSFAIFSFLGINEKIILKEQNLIFIFLTEKVKIFSYKKFIIATIVMPISSAFNFFKG